LRTPKGNRQSPKKAKCYCFERGDALTCDESLDCDVLMEFRSKNLTSNVKPRSDMENSVFSVPGGFFTI
jgi:hypothetical protein